MVSNGRTLYGRYDSTDAPTNIGLFERSSQGFDHNNEEMQGDRITLSKIFGIVEETHMLSINQDLKSGYGDALIDPLAPLLSEAKFTKYLAKKFL